ncbi:MAG: 50S ribosomal protein L24 [Bacillota bacterium]|nr:50S ribosomal protein L24 [Bacillota bacterium]
MQAGGRGTAVKAKVHLRKGDTVQVISGKDAGRRGKVLRVIPASRRVVVEGVNIAKKHRKPTPKVMQGGIIEQENPIDASNAMVVCPSCDRPTRVGHRILEDGRKVRVCKRCGEVIDR